MENEIISPENQDRPALPPKRAAGGWKAIRYILANETFEKLASMSLIANLVVYLHTKYNLDNVASANVFNIWAGTTNIAPLAGAFLADAYLGRFRTLLFGSIASLLVHLILSELRPVACTEQSHCQPPQFWQLSFLYLGLGLLAVGAGGLRPCNIAFGADQFDSTTEKGRAQLESFCNWWYFLFTASLIVALTGVVYVQTNISWTAGFAIPTGCFLLSISIFLIGRHTYIYMKPQGSVFSSIIKVIVAAYRKRHVSMEEASYQPFYDPPQKETEPQITKLLHTNRLSCLDKAAIHSDPSELNEQGKPKNAWKLCTLQQVEQLKCVIGLVPVWLSGIGCFIAMHQMGSFGILQAIQMNRSIGRHFQIPPAWMGLVPMLALSIWIYFYERIYIHLIHKKAKNDGRLTMETRIRIGIIMSILCMVAAGVLEKVRRDSALKNGSIQSPLNVALLIPQFALSGLTEAFAAIALMEFLTTQSPDSMRTVAGAIFFLSLSIASYLSSVLISIITKNSGINRKSPWLGGNDLNQNRLDYFYYTVATLGALNFLYFHFFARNYLSNGNAGNSRKTSERELKDEENDLQVI